MERAGIGGLNKTVFFALTTLNAFDTTPLLTMDRNVSRDYKGHEAKKALTTTFDSRVDDEEISDFINDFMTEEIASGAGTNEVEYEDASKEGGASADDSSPKFGFIDYITKYNGKVKIKIGYAKLGANTGDSKTGARTIGGVSLERISVKASSNITVPSGCWINTIVKVGGGSDVPTSIPAGEIGVEKFVTPP